MGRGAGGPRDDRASRFRAPPCNEPPLPSLQRGVGADALLPGPSRGERIPEDRALVLPALRYHLPPGYGGLAMTRKKGGGRESVPTGDTEADRAAETGRAAANPAAPVCDHERGLCNHWEMHDRIRELEAAEEHWHNRALLAENVVRELAARVRELEADNA